MALNPDSEQEMASHDLTTERVYTVDELVDDSDIQTRGDMSGHPRDRVRILDLFSGRGAVGLALDHFFNRVPAAHQIIGEFIGIDKEDYSTEYPGKFIQHYINDLTLEDLGLDEKVDLVWASPPCQPYSKGAAQYYDNLPEGHPLPTIPDLNLHEVCKRLGNNYVIENVPGCTDLNEDRVVKVNGAAFDLPINFERHFEVSFIEEFQQRGTTDYRASLPSDLIKFQDATIEELCRGKQLPTEHHEQRDWSQAEARAAIPPSYVAFVLSHCPTLDDLSTPSGDADWWTYSALDEGQHSITSFTDSQA